LLNNVEISSRISEHKLNIANNTELSIKWVVNNLKTVVERCMRQVPVIDKDGNSIGEYRFDASGANRALELLGKHIQEFQRKKLS